MAVVSRYWHMIRHLKPVQVYGRVLYRLSRPRPDLRPAPPIRLSRSDVFVVGAERSASMLGPLEFRFLNDTRTLSEHGWDDPALGKLWRYNLHYFDDLNARDAQRRSAWHRALLVRWVRDNPPAEGTGWEPYPTSLRIVNWVKWAIRGNDLPPVCVDSLAVQARWLSNRLETHLLGNHLFVNAKALVLAGLYFAGPDAADWLERGMRILAAQVPEQILSDGGQFELSPMYHALALEDMLDLCNVAAAGAVAVPVRWQPEVSGWLERVGMMRSWLLAMTHPDGEIAFFNDAAIGIAPSPGELEAYCARLGLQAGHTAVQAVTRLSASGYVRMGRGPAVAMLDVGSVGPDYLPAHAHADTLSFELSVFGQRVLVNSGTSRYGVDAERLRERGTAAHNTVVVDGENSSEVWSGFRVARRARPLELDVTADSGGITVRCAHDGYRRLPGRVLHARQWSLDAGALLVADTLSGRYRTAQARFHLHPGIVVRETSADGDLTLALPGGQTIHVVADGGRLRHEPATWHPQFGTTQPNRCIVVDATGPLLRTRFSWGAGG